MFSAEKFRAVIFSIVTILLICNLGPQGNRTKRVLWLQSAQAASEQPAAQFPGSKVISPKVLAKYKPISVTIEEDGKEVQYSGVPLRAVFADMVPEQKLDSMPEWKALNRQELVVEVMGEDGYPALVPATDLAINKAGDRFLLATERDGKQIDAGVHLICKMDEAHVRWVRQVVHMRIVSVSKKQFD